MEIITMEEFEELELARPIMPLQMRQQIASLKIGEAITIARDEWPLRSSPMDYFAAYGNKWNMVLSVRLLKDRSGWAVLRQR